MVKISVIIPVYNIEQYLSKCLDSVANQTLRDIEIICVNDGSGDGSLKILKEYAEKDERIVLINKENTGYGHSMNTGLEKACGEYISIVESDDFCELNMLEALYNRAKEYELEVCRGHFYNYNSEENISEKKKFPNVKINEVFCPVKSRNKAIFYTQPSIWAAIYKADFLKKNNIRFLETKGASYQDTSFNFKVNACAKRFMVIDETLIHYRVDSGGSSVSSKGKVFCVCDEYREIENFAKKLENKEIKYTIAKMKFITYRWNFNRLEAPYKYEFLKQFSKEFRKAFLRLEIWKEYFNKRDLMRVFLIAFIPWIYKNWESL